jgi:hypothetical protein
MVNFNCELINEISSINTKDIQHNIQHTLYNKEVFLSLRKSNFNNTLLEHKFRTYTKDILVGHTNFIHVLRGASWQ